MSEWISVEDKLPCLEKTVRVKNEHDEVYEASLFFEGQFIYDDDLNIIGTGDPEYSWSVELGFSDYCGDDITHWMPLPEPTK